MEVKEVIFLENGKYYFIGGLIIVKFEVVYLLSLFVRVFCFYIKVFKNYGYFIYFDFLIVKIEEIYDNVMLFNNFFVELFFDNNSLYNFVVKKICVKFSNFRCFLNYLL